MKAILGGCPPISRNTRRFPVAQQSVSQVQRNGKADQKVVCTDVTLRQIEHVVVMEKINGSRSQPSERGRRAS